MAREPVEQLMPRQTLIYAGAILLLAMLLSDNAFVSEVSKSLSVLVLNLIGFAAQDLGHAIRLGQLELSWTDDCSGVNALLMVWALCLWVHRDIPFSPALIARLVLCVPLALMLNIARILSIAAYRYIYYPNWESPELHYFIGFVWILPCLPLLVPQFRQKSTAFWLNLIYGAIALSLLAPMLLNPGGLLALVCGLLILSRNEVQAMSALRIGMTILWCATGFLIASSATESLWLPWLLTSPIFLHDSWTRGWALPLLLAGTVSVVGMNDYAYWSLLLIAGGYAFYSYRQQATDAAEPEPVTWPKPATAMLVAGLVAAPLFAPMLFNNQAMTIDPPPGVLSQKVSANGYQFKVVGQSRELASFWFGPFSDGRHHSLLSCLTFRGIELEAVETHPNVFSGEEKWMTEFFIHDGELLDNYYQYLIASLKPFSDPGVHLIFETPAAAMTPALFRQEATRASVAALRNYRNKHNI